MTSNTRDEVSNHTEAKVDPVFSVLTRRPMSSSELIHELHKYPGVGKRRIGRYAASKRIERLFKAGKIGRYLRIERGAYIYYLPGIHSEDFLQRTSRDIALRSSGLLSRILGVVSDSKIISALELGRLANTRFQTADGQISQRVIDLVAKAKKLGLRLKDNWLISPLVPKNKVKELVGSYEAAIDEEAHLLAFARRLFIEKKRAQEMTLYRQPGIESIASNKFDMFGHGGRKNPIRIIVECNLRRGATHADLEGFSQRVAGTMSKGSKQRRYSAPIARYYIAPVFSVEAKTFAASKRKGIRLLDAESLMNGRLEEVQSYEVSSKRKPIYYGRFKEVKGAAFEAEIERVYKEFKTKRRKTFYVEKGRITDTLGEDSRTARKLTDVDVFGERKTNGHEILLVECKSGIEKLPSKIFFAKTRKYLRIAHFLEARDSTSKVRIVVIANVDEDDKKEFESKHKMMDFYTPEEFYKENRKMLEGAPKWLFGIEKTR